MLTRSDSTKAAFESEGKSAYGQDSLPSPALMASQMARYRSPSWIGASYSFGTIPAMVAPVLATSPMNHRFRESRLMKESGRAQ